MVGRDSRVKYRQEVKRYINFFDLRCVTGTTWVCFYKRKIKMNNRIVIKRVNSCISRSERRKREKEDDDEGTKRDTRLGYTGVVAILKGSETSEGTRDTHSLLW